MRRIETPTCGNCSNGLAACCRTGLAACYRTGLAACYRNGLAACETKPTRNERGIAQEANKRGTKGQEK